MINFDIEKKGYNKEQVSEYFKHVEAEYEKLYEEYERLYAQLQQTQQQLMQASVTHNVSPERLEAIAMALVDAETEAQRIVATARDKAWKILTDAQKGLPMAEEPGKQNLLIDAQEIKPEQASPTQPQKPDLVHEPKSVMDDIDQLIASILDKI